jgi:hypothetical protein
MENIRGKTRAWMGRILKNILRFTVRGSVPLEIPISAKIIKIIFHEYVIFVWQCRCKISIIILEILNIVEGYVMAKTMDNIIIKH